MEQIVIYNYKAPISEDTFNDIYQLIVSSFPNTERRSRDGHLGEFSIPYFSSLCYQPDGVKALMNYWEFDEFIFLEHFAVSEQLRGKGIGSSMMSELQKLSGNKPIVLEAEPPQCDEIAARRIMFYKRLGFTVNDYEYWQPALQPDELPIQLVLLTSNGALSFEDFIRIKETLYKYVYEVDVNNTPDGKTV